MDITRASVARQSLLRAVEPLWVAGLGIQFIVLGSLLLPRLIRMLGRGGAVETVEWAVYMSTLVVLPPVVWIVGWIIPRTVGSRAAVIVHRGLVLLVVIEFGVYAALRSQLSLVIAAIVVSAFGVDALRGMRMAGLKRTSSRMAYPAVTLAVAAACGTAGWMAAGGLVSWQNALDWVFTSLVTLAVLLASVIIVANALSDWVSSDSNKVAKTRALDLVPMALLVAFSFRTFPVVEHFHWGFFVGPIEQLRQGGTLLWDTPSQYGFLSILIPSLLPGSAWQSFWFFQSVLYAIVACMMYMAIRRLSPSWWTAAAAFIITFTTLFFRPRTESLILPAQMTPAAGPFRFIWCFVMLAFLVRWHGSERQDSGLRFAITGTVIWTLALLWSAETAIYVTAMWLPALLIHTLQAAAAAAQDGAARGTIAKLVSTRAALPFACLLVAVVVVVAAYRVTLGFSPDLMSYLDYVLLYSSGGFGALPIDPTGSIWYLVLSFLIVSTILALHAVRNPRDSRLIVWAAAWGAIWAISSYFTGRSHPVNLIALIPVLIVTLVACMRMRPFAGSPYAGYVLAASVLPLFAMPVTLTAGHGSFARAVTEAQLSPARFAEQVPLMDPDLQSLLAAAGAKPTDSFVLVSDGRLMLQAWNMSGLATATGTAEVERALVTRSWLPKAFEIVGSLPEDRRQAYFERNARSFPGAGWLIQSKALSATGADHLLRFVKSSRREERRLENDKWIVSWMGPARRASD